MDVNNAFAAQALRCEEDNRQIELRLAELLGDRTHLDTAVLGIEWSSDSVRIRTADGGFVVDACVTTVPASVWCRIDFTPALPDWKVRAFDKVEYSHAAELGGWRRLGKD